MTVKQTVFVKEDGTTVVKRARLKRVRPRQQPCPECGEIMSIVSVPQLHYACDSESGCNLTRDINPDTGEMTDHPFAPDDIGDIVFDEWD